MTDSQNRALNRQGEKERPAKVRNSYVCLPDQSRGWMTWPNPADPEELQHRLRYGPPLNSSEQLLAASYLEAYAYLVLQLPQRTRNQRCSEIKAALASQESPDA